MKIRRKIWGTAFLLCLAMACLSGCGGGKDVIAKGSPLVEIDNERQSMERVYTKGFQDHVREQLLALQNGEHTLENPLVVANPYGTNTTGLYVWFETKKPAKVSYTVSVPGLPDFSRTLYNGTEEPFATTHEYLLIGCVPEHENTVCLRAENKFGRSLGSYTFSYLAPPTLSPEISIQAEVIEGESAEPLADGLFTVMGNDKAEAQDSMTIYDNDGVLRCEIPIVGYRVHDLLFDEDGMYYSISSRKLARMDRTGYINRVYDLGYYSLHHDYAFGMQEDILMLASRQERGTKDDSVISLDPDTGRIRELVDLRTLFPDYVASMRKPQGAPVLDWMHINTISPVGEDSVILSSRETSTIIRLDGLYESPRVNYLIGSDRFWAGSGYEDLLLTQKGDFSLQCGQHSVLYEPDDSLPEGQYYLIMFDNNNTYSLQRKEYDWAADDNYYDTGVANESGGNPSYYYKYLVDEGERTFTLVDSLPLDYSGFVSCVQPVGDHLVTDSGNALTAAEFDRDHRLIRKFRFLGEKWIYRTKKYEYLDYWFVKD